MVMIVKFVDAWVVIGFNPGDGGSMFLWNVCIRLQNYTCITSHDTFILIISFNK
jgi:hypothetical protein